MQQLATGERLLGRCCKVRLIGDQALFGKFSARQGQPRSLQDTARVPTPRSPAVDRFGGKFLGVRFLSGLLIEEVLTYKNIPRSSHIIHHQLSVKSLGCLSHSLDLVNIQTRSRSCSGNM
eukprot:6490564-Amphidinium_carterae.1